MPSSLELRFSLQLVLRNGEELYLVVQVHIWLDTACVNAGTGNVGYIQLQRWTDENIL